MTALGIIIIFLFVPWGAMICAAAVQVRNAKRGARNKTAPRLITSAATRLTLRRVA